MHTHICLYRYIHTYIHTYRNLYIYIDKSISTNLSLIYFHEGDFNNVNYIYTYTHISLCIYR